MAWDAASFAFSFSRVESCFALTSGPAATTCLRAEPARCATAAWFWTVAGANAVTADADRASAGKLQ
jgi:hypothetical protein